MRRILLVGLIFVFSEVWASQPSAGPYWNGWIVPTQQYYKFPVVSDGWYRIPYSTLSAAFGSTLSTLRQSDFILFHNGQQVCLYVTTANTFGPNDYIGFYGQHNTGDSEYVLYDSSNWQPHPYYSLFNDTSYYYLTISTAGGALRYTLANPSGTPPAAEQYFTYNSRQFFTAQNGQNIQGYGWYVGLDEEIWSCLFDVGEGYADATFIGGFPSSNPPYPQVVSKTYSIPTPGVYTGNNAPASNLYAVFANYSVSELGFNPGASSEDHSIQYNVNSANIYTEGLQPGFALNKISRPFPTSYLTSSSTNVTVQSQTGLNTQSFQQNVVYLNEIDYPRNFDFSGLNTLFFHLNSNGATQRYLQIANFSNNGFSPSLFDTTQHAWYQPYSTSGDTFNFLISGSGAHDLFLMSNDPTSFSTVNSITPFIFQDYSSLLSNCDYAIITDSSLMVDVDGLGYDVITEYAHHRDANYNPATGKYHPEIFAISQLYDQFAFGVRKSPLAIRNFIQFALNKYPGKLKFVFLIGKGLQYPQMRSANNPSFGQCLVPSWGQPASDNLLAATRGSHVPTVALGRLAANNARQVYAYLRKITVYDSLQTYNAFGNMACVDIPDKLWQKQILHFSGGSTGFEQTIFAQYLTNYGNAASDTFWGANVTPYSKVGTAPISQSEASVIQNQIDSGVSLVTFFGHASADGFDFSINEPENYTNKNKYPVILSNGCFSGDIFETVQSPTTASYSERFVLEPNIGAIAFLATTNLSVNHGLNAMSQCLYDTFCVPKYYNAFGTSFKQMLTHLMGPQVSLRGDTLTCAFEMVFHGDPGLWLNQYPKPDYALEQHPGSSPASVYLTPAVVTPGLDSFQLNVIVTNLGKAINKTIAVSVQRTVTPVGGNAVVLPAMIRNIKAPYYRDTVSFTLPVNVSSVVTSQGVLGPGLNQFAVMLDANDAVDEMTKCNNGYTISTSIQADDLQPIYPYEFAIDSDPNVVLKTSTTNPFAPLRKYDFQFDTTRAFNSPFMQQYSVTQVGGVLHWNHPTLLNKDSTVYYWRVKIDTSSTWHYSSFVHIPHMYGWQQSHFWQFTQDNYLRLKLDTTPRVFQFDSTVNNITVCTGQANAASPPGPVDFENMGWNYNNVNMYRYRMGGCGFAAGITFAVIDSVTGLPWISYNTGTSNYGDTYGNWMCQGQLSFQYGFDFSTSTSANPKFPSLTWNQCIAKFIDSIPNGDYVLMYSDNMVPYTQWDPTLVNALQGLNPASPFLASLYKSGTYYGPFIYFTKKGNSTYHSTMVPASGQTTYDSIAVSINFTGAWYQGQMLSPTIGPAVKWGQVQWNKRLSDNPKIYKDSVDIIGINSNGAPTVLRTTGLYNNSIQNISPQQYPMLQLRFRTENDSLHLASQLTYWRVIYQKPAELAINPAAYFSLKNNQSIGGAVQLQIGLENVTKIRMDSVLVKYSLTNAANNSSGTQIRYGPMPGIDTLILNYSLGLNSSGYQGTNQLTLEVNPKGDHIEQFHWNNFATVTFSAAGDSLNPLLNVTFDGQQIMNGDIVSAKPDILIGLHDNNKYLPLKDSSALTVYLLAPGSTVPVHINYDNQTLRFYPADTSNNARVNKCEAEFKPVLPIDGTYELLVRDADRSGNHSSVSANRVEYNTYYDYKVDFQVINKPMISNVLNYPNPFSTSTRFIFTVTGSEVPQYMKIRIMTVRGVVVKEITQEELGPLHVGTNITEYAWDGHDQFGSRLANGVYFYQVVTRENNQNMTKLSESYDQYFKKGIGKLVILR